MLQPSEVVDLVIAIVLLPIIFTSSRAMRGPIRVLILAAFGSVVVGYVFTILEGYFLENLFNTLEHAAYASAGVLTLLALLGYYRWAVVQRGGAQ